MHVIQLFLLLLAGVHIEILKSRLPERSQRLSRLHKGNRNCAALGRLLRLLNFRATRSFNFCSTVEGVPCFGSLISRCTCSGITT